MVMRIVMAAFFLIASMICAQAEETDFLDSVIMTGEILNMQGAFALDVSMLSVDWEYESWAKAEAVKMIGMKEPFWLIEPSQYFVFADRNPKKQLIMIGYYFASSKEIFIIGWDKCSTGNPAHGGDYHFTPTGIFENNLDHFSFRAAGTKNSKGWRGYGLKHSRIWDFGYQDTTKPIKGKEQWRQIRLLMHATDPDGGEPKLGTPQSKGCVRISHKLNKFLDKYGIIDALYESSTGNSVRWLLLKDRTPVSHAGRCLIIGDSEKK